MKKERVFYALVRGTQVLSINWYGNGKAGVYHEFAKHPDDEVIRVKEVKHHTKKRPTSWARSKQT